MLATVFEEGQTKIDSDHHERTQELYYFAVANSAVLALKAFKHKYSSSCKAE